VNRPGEWAARGRCTQSDPELWTHEHDGNNTHRNCGHAHAAHQCNTHCPVRTECFAWATSDVDRGIDDWAGMVVAGFMVLPGARRQIRTRTNGYRYETTWMLKQLRDPPRCHSCGESGVASHDATDTTPAT
jgi:transcription factor WhiB